MDKEQSALAKQIETEVSDYLTKPVQLGDGISYSEHKLKRRIALFESQTYPTGKFDAQGNYKYWNDIITPAIESEVKNIDFDTRNIEAYSPRKIDQLPNLIVNLKLTEYLRETGQAEEINSAIEEGAGWGNVLWKKVRGSYERMDLRNVYVINQVAQSVKNSPVIERHEMQQDDIREQEGWKKKSEVLAECAQNTYKSDVAATDEQKTTPYYEIYERNGMVKLSDLKAENGEAILPEDSTTYVFAKVIAAGTSTQSGVKIKYVVKALENPGRDNSDIYKEYHRSAYKGRWFRKGLYEILFDVQVRYNEVSNQLAQGLQYAATLLFTDEDKLLIQNVLTDMKNGDFIRSKNLRQVETRLQGFDQLIGELNRLESLANKLSNSREIVQGDSLPSGTPFRMGALLNANANKLYDFIREKFSIPMREMYEEHIIPQMVKKLTMEDVIRLTGDSDILQRIHQMIVDDWYVKNLVVLGPHPKEMAEALKQEKLAELKKQTVLLRDFQKFFKGYSPRVSVVITGENVDLPERLQTIGTFIQLEQDPVRRSHLIEMAMRLKGIDVGTLPRSTPEQLSGGAQPAKSPIESVLGEPVPTA